MKDRGRENQVKGTAEKMKGRTKDAAGSLTGNRKMEGEGKKDQAKGKIREETGKTQREAAGDRKKI
ncbi:MAG: CsbD family protein [Acidobacteria bacterium]|nr:CsbD family protein [Acidobacteriota bacterium]